MRTFYSLLLFAIAVSIVACDDAISTGSKGMARPEFETLSNGDNTSRLLTTFLPLTYIGADAERLPMIGTMKVDGTGFTPVVLAGFLPSPPRNGTMVYISFSMGTESIVVSGIDGTNARTLHTLDGSNGWFEHVSPVLSPDGSKVAYVILTDPLDPENSKRELWVASADGTEKKKITEEILPNSTPSFSSDSRSLAWCARWQRGRGKLMLLDLGETGGQREIANDVNDGEGICWSPNGDRILYTATANLRPGIVSLEIAGGTKTLIGSGTHPSYSPDGTRIVFASMQSEIIVANPDGTGLTTLRKPQPYCSERYPQWSADGQRIVCTEYYQNPYEQFGTCVVIDAATGEITSRSGTPQQGVVGYNRIFWLR